MRDQWRRTRQGRDNGRRSQDLDDSRADRKAGKPGRARRQRDKRKIKNEQNFIENLIVEEHRERELIESD